VLSALPADVSDLVRVINAAYEVEKFFVSGDRTDAETVRYLMTKGTFLVEKDVAGAVCACVYVERRGSRGYFGMLAVDPAHQGTGLGRKVIEAAEQYARDGGATVMDISVVNLRTELPRFYRRLGYVESGTEATSDPRALQPFHFIVMSKAL
jgi:GNAT superfamily N-acetyltransferase